MRRALQESDIKTVDIPVRDLNDGLMIKIMANENMEEWKMNPAVVNENVQAAKEYLDKELAKCKTWETSNKFIRGLFDNQRGFETAKGMGIGRKTILKFLGGNWKGWVIQDALNTLQESKAGTIDREAVESLPSVRHSREFKTAVKQSIGKKENKIPVKTKLLVTSKKIEKESIENKISKTQVANSYEYRCQYKQTAVNTLLNTMTLVFSLKTVF